MRYFSPWIRVRRVTHSGGRTRPKCRSRRDGRAARRTKGSTGALRRRWSEPRRHRPGRPGATPGSLGERLREIRKQKSSLQEGSRRSPELEFKASVLGAYEQGDGPSRSPGCTGWPASTGCPSTSSCPAADDPGTPPRPRVDAPRGRIDLTRLEDIAGAEADAEPLPADDPGAAPGLQQVGCSPSAVTTCRPSPASWG